MTRKAAFLEAASVALDLLRDRRVAERWKDPSALPKMSVGALAHHLGGQVVSAHAAAAEPSVAGHEEPVSVLEHYQRAAWVRADLDDEANVSIREGAERSSADGYDGLLVRVESALAALQPWPRGAATVVRMPWWDWCLSADDFLLTRMMELMVHTDDLAVSVDVATPVFPRVVSRPVTTLLTSIAEQQHGQAAVIRALTRAERAPASIVVF